MRHYGPVELDLPACDTASSWLASWIREVGGQQAFRAIIDANGMTQAEMGRITGSESAVSMFFKGERGLSKTQIKALVERFRVDASLFL